MNKTVIVTDSTADIPADLAKQHNIHIVPLRLMFGEDTYLDGVEITPESSTKAGAIAPASNDLPAFTRRFCSCV